MTEHDTNVRPLLVGSRVAGVTVSLKNDPNEGLGGRTVCHRVVAAEDSAAEPADGRRTNERLAAA